MVVSMATELDHEHPHAQGHQGQRHQEASAGVLKLDPCHPPPNKIIFPAKQKKKAKKSLSAKHKPEVLVTNYDMGIGLGWGCYAHHQAVL